MADVLYVVCHGLISLVEKRDGSYRALMVEMDDHVYRAGTWLNERPIAPGVFALTGVKGHGVVLPRNMQGSSSLDPAKNVVIPNVRIPDLGAGVRTIIDLPAPAAVHSYGQVDIKSQLTGDQLILDKVGRTLSAVRVFVYEIDGNASDVKLGNHRWEAVAGRRNTPGIAVLHLLNEPSEDMLSKPLAQQEAHNVEEFTRAAKILGANLAISRASSALPEKVANLLPGLASLELEPLVARENAALAVAEAVISPSLNPQGTAPAACLPADGRE